jgi:Leucine-rich repeat (LRR) protein
MASKAVQIQRSDTIQIGSNNSQEEVKNIGKLNINDKSSIMNEKNVEILKKLDLSFKSTGKKNINEGLLTFDSLNYPSYRSYNLKHLTVLNLRNNQLANLQALHLKELKFLTDLDLSHNAFAGVVISNIFPLSLKKLNLSGNYLDDIGGFISCPLLETLNLSDNCLKVISALPPSLRILDLSHNLLHSLNNLRMLTFSPLITVFSIVDNPIVEISCILRVTICSILVKLEQLDDEFLGGYKLRQQRMLAQNLKETKIVDEAKQREADFNRSILQTKRLAASKNKIDEMTTLVEMELKTSPSKSVFSPSKTSSPRTKKQQIDTSPRTKKQQNETDLLRSTASLNKEQLLKQKQQAIVDRFKAQARCKTVLNKESAKSLVDRLSKRSPSKQSTLNYDDQVHNNSEDNYKNFIIKGKGMTSKSYEKSVIPDPIDRGVCPSVHSTMVDSIVDNEVLSSHPVASSSMEYSITSDEVSYNTIPSPTPPSPMSSTEKDTPDKNAAMRKINSSGDESSYIDDDYDDVVGIKVEHDKSVKEVPSNYVVMRKRLSRINGTKESIGISRDQEKGFNEPEIIVQKSSVSIDDRNIAALNTTASEPFVSTMNMVDKHNKNTINCEYNDISNVAQDVTTYENLNRDHDDGSYEGNAEVEEEGGESSDGCSDDVISTKGQESFDEDFDEIGEGDSIIGIFICNVHTHLYTMVIYIHKLS